MSPRCDHGVFRGTGTGGEPPTEWRCQECRITVLDVFAEKNARIVELEAAVRELRECIREIAHGAQSGRSYANRILADTAALVPEVKP